MSLRVSIFDVQKLTRLFLPREKRQKNRVKLLNVFLKPIDKLYKEFSEWQIYIRSFKVTSQVAILENYLKEKFNNDVTVKTFFDGGFLICLNSSEGDYRIENYADIYLKGEAKEYFEECDYMVHISKDVSLELVKKEIERFRRAGKKVKTKQY